MAGLLDLAKNAEDPRVRLAAWEMIANRSDGRAREIAREVAEEALPLTGNREELIAEALRVVQAARLKMGNGNGQAS